MAKTCKKNHQKLQPNIDWIYAQYLGPLDGEWSYNTKGSDLE